MRAWNISGSCAGDGRTAHGASGVFVRTASGIGNSHRRGHHKDSGKTLRGHFRDED